MKRRRDVRAQIVLQGRPVEEGRRRVRRPVDFLLEGSVLHHLGLHPPQHHHYLRRHRAKEGQDSRQVQAPN